MLVNVWKNPQSNVESLRIPGSISAAISYYQLIIFTYRRCVFKVRQITVRGQVQVGVGQVIAFRNTLNLKDFSSNVTGEDNNTGWYRPGYRCPEHSQP